MRTRLNHMIGMVLLLLVVGCGTERAVVRKEPAVSAVPTVTTVPKVPKLSPPQTETWSNGGVGGVGLEWGEGLRLVVMYVGESTSEECHTRIAERPTGTTMEYGCVTPFTDGRRVVWESVSTDGKTGSMTINGALYAIPADGTVFTVDAQGTITGYQRAIPAFAQREGAGMERLLLEWLMSDPDFAPYVSTR